MTAFIVPQVVGACSLTLGAGRHGSGVVCWNAGKRNGSMRVGQRTETRAKLDALIFDCDGVLADTERDAHRVAFNLAFEEKGLDTQWDEALYGKLLETGGGKERMTAYWTSVGWPSGYEEAEQQVALVRGLHARKTELFMELVEQGKVPLRPGVQRLASEAVANGVSVAVCSTSNEKAVQKIVDMLGGLSSGIVIFAGDVVQQKKPAPDIYNLARDAMSLRPDHVCVVEDSFIGVSSARAAGMPVVVTKSTYTKDEDFAKAQRVVESLDDPMTTLEDLDALVSEMRLHAS